MKHAIHFTPIISLNDSESAKECKQLKALKRTFPMLNFYSFSNGYVFSLSPPIKKSKGGLNGTQLISI